MSRFFKTAGPLLRMAPSQVVSLRKTSQSKAMPSVAMPIKSGCSAFVVRKDDGKDDSHTSCISFSHPSLTSRPSWGQELFSYSGAIYQSILRNRKNGNIDGNVQVDIVTCQTNKKDNQNLRMLARETARNFGHYQNWLDLEGIRNLNIEIGHLVNCGPGYFVNRTGDLDFPYDYLTHQKMEQIYHGVNIDDDLEDIIPEAFIYHHLGFPISDHALKILEEKLSDLLHVRDIEKIQGLLSEQNFDRQMEIRTQIDLIRGKVTNPILIHDSGTQTDFPVLNQDDALFIDGCRHIFLQNPEEFINNRENNKLSDIIELYFKDIFHTEDKTTMLYELYDRIVNLFQFEELILKPYLEFKPKNPSPTPNPDGGGKQLDWGEVDKIR